MVTWRPMILQIQIPEQLCPTYCIQVVKQPPYIKTLH